MENKKLNKCCVCGGNSLKSILNLPKLPLTGIYFPTSEKASRSELIDQAFNICQNCGHGQLDVAVDPKIVYDNSYTHRSSLSIISKGSNNFFANKIIEKGLLSKTKKVLEIGCNDGYLLNIISPLIKEAIGIDPIWIEKEVKTKGNIKIKGGYASEIEKIVPDNFNPDLVLSSHTFEHTIDLYEDLKKAVNISNNGTIFCIEMPSLDTMIRLRRFDQVFHQHIQYICESSIQRLVDRLNCNLISIEYNYSLWGGTVLFIFKKEKSDKRTNNILCKKISSKEVDNSLKEFRNYINLIESQIGYYDSFCYLGAAQMLPIVDYHLKGIKDKSLKILDDNETRIDHFLPNMSIPIKSLRNIEHIKNTAYLIGAIDSSKAIISRAKEQNLINIFSLFQNLI